MDPSGSGWAVQRHRFQLDPDDLLHLQLLEDAVKNAVPGPPAHPHIDGVPAAEALRQTTPCSATYRTAFNTCRLHRLTLPRCTGNTLLIHSHCASVSSIGKNSLMEI
jgi:hypothetical protein